MKVNLQSLSKYRDLKISDNPEITISLKNIPRVDWPEHVSNDEMLLINYNCAYVSRKKKRKIL